MELTIADVAGTSGTTVRHVRRAIATGELHALRTIGRTTVLDDLAVQAWERSRFRGRRWSGEVREAAFDLIEQGSTARLSSSERSRLRASLKQATPRRIAHLAGGLEGAWARYRTVLSVPQLNGATPTAVPPDSGMLGESHLAFITTPSLDTFELDNDVILDASGNLGVIERDQTRPAQALLDTYLLAGSRDSAAAAATLTKVIHEF